MLLGLMMLQPVAKTDTNPIYGMPVLGIEKVILFVKKVYHLVYGIDNDLFYRDNT